VFPSPIVSGRLLWSGSRSQHLVIKMYKRPSAENGQLGRVFFVAFALFIWSPALAQVQDRGSQIPTLAPVVKETTPSVVNISVRARVKEDNPLYRDPVFREFFDLPKQLEKEVQATGSGVIVDAEHGYVLTANHVVAQISSALITTKDGRKFAAKLDGIQRPTSRFCSYREQEAISRRSRSATATGSRLATTSLRSAIPSVWAKP
jgi:S1-C subfamily serine protease